MAHQAVAEWGSYELISDEHNKLRGRGPDTAAFFILGRCAMKQDAQQYDSVKAPQIDAGREFISIAGIRKTDSMLDPGCGTGKLTRALARLAKHGERHRH